MTKGSQLRLPYIISFRFFLGFFALSQIIVELHQEGIGVNAMHHTGLFYPSRPRRRGSRGSAYQSTKTSAQPAGRTAGFHRSRCFFQLFSSAIPPCMIIDIIPNSSVFFNRKNQPFLEICFMQRSRRPVFRRAGHPVSGNYFQILQNMSKSGCFHCICCSTYSLVPSPIFCACSRQLLYSALGVVFSKWS